MLDKLTEESTKYLQLALTSPAEMLGLAAVVAAAVFVLVSTFVKTMIPLRWLAVGSNIGFVAYGAIHPSYPMLLLHAALLPINLYRLAEMMRLTRRVERVSAQGELSTIWLRPYMRSAQRRAGSIIFKQGDLGDRLYLLARGKIDLLEIGRQVNEGQIFGEIAFFTPDRRRRATARCAVDCTVLSIDESTMRQLYYQNPAFGFKMIELVASRLSSDVGRLTRDLMAARAAAQPAAASDDVND